MSFSTQKNEKPSNSRRSWLDLQFIDDSKNLIKKPNELESSMEEPPGEIDPNLFDRIAGSMLGLAIGDALGAHVEFRPHDYLAANPVTDFQAGGTWGLDKGQFTDDTSMALCLASSLITCQRLNLYDQLVRYKWWYKYGYMSSTGQCFDIGAATKSSIDEFERRQKEFAESNKIRLDEMDRLSDVELIRQFPTYCSEEGVAGNGALMRLAPVPLFFFNEPRKAVEYSGQSGQITHGDQKARDACRYYGALIVAACRGYKKEELLDDEFYQKESNWFGSLALHPDILEIAHGSYKKRGGYDDGIRGKGYVVPALEAALWAFWSTETFEDGALAAVNLGDDTDTTAAIYGQLAGCFYGLKKLPEKWLKKVYARDFLLNISGWLTYGSEQRKAKQKSSKSEIVPATSMNAGLPPTGLPTRQSKIEKTNEKEQLDRPKQPEEFALDSEENRKRFKGIVETWMKPLFQSFSVELVYREDLYRSFLGQIERRINEKRKEIEVPDRIKQLANRVKHYRPSSIYIVRGWFGCDAVKKSQILENGFNELDPAMIKSNGKGLSLRSSEKYAAEDINSDDYLIMCHVILHDVTTSIMKKSSNGEQYRFFNGEKPSTGREASKSTGSRQPSRNPADIKNGLYDQIIVFDSKDILVQTVVHVQSKSRPVRDSRTHSTKRK